MYEHHVKFYTSNTKFMEITNCLLITHIYVNFQMFTQLKYVHMVMLLPNY